MKNDDADLAKKRFTCIPAFKVVGEWPLSEEERMKADEDAKRFLKEVREAREKAKKKKELLNNQPTE